MKKMLNKTRGFLASLYVKLFKINDTPQRIALGFGLGVFTGIFPGSGPIAALFLALLLKANRASALLGSLLTNTWLSFVTFLLAVKAGSLIMQVDWQETINNWSGFLNAFRWADLCKISLLKLILPVAIGYAAVGLCLGLLAYLAALIIAVRIRCVKK